MFTLDLARAHIHDLHREADRDRVAHTERVAAHWSGRLRRLVHRTHG